MKTSRILIRESLPKINKSNVKFNTIDSNDYINNYSMDMNNNNNSYIKNLHNTINLSNININNP